MVNGPAHGKQLVQIMDDNTSSASKKRKHNCHGHDGGIIIVDQEEDDEEEKMEKFFALVQNIREARYHLLSGSNAKKQLEIMETIRFTKRKLDDDQVEVWKPSFRREDFLEETFDHHQLTMMKNNHPATSNHVSAAATSSQTQTKPKAAEKEEIEEAAGLDLSLSL